MQVEQRPDMREDVKHSYLYEGTRWKWGSTPSAEIWNGRLAMLGFLAATLVEIFSGQGYLHFLGFLSGPTSPLS
jgi:hypothetical protein